MATSIDTQCPYIDINIPADGIYNDEMYYECSDGTVYIFYKHWDGFDEKYNCQFCKLIGRKKDVFECLNENEWKECPHYKFHDKK
jgi:hypothetical protein